MVAPGNRNSNGNGTLVPAPRPHALAQVRSGVPLESEPKALSVRTVHHAIRRWWRWALPIGLVAAATVAAIVWFTFEPVYEARAWLHIQEEAPYLAFKQGGGSRQFVNTQRELLRSPLVLEQVLADPRVGRREMVTEHDEPVEWLRESLEIRSVGDSEVFEVALTAWDPQGATQIVNAVVDVYLKFQRSSDTERTLEILRRLAQQREAREAIVRTMRENVRQLARQVAGTDVGSTESSIVFQHPFSDLRGKLTDAEVQRELLQAELAAARQLQPAAAPAYLIGSADVEDHPEVERLRNEQAELAARLDRVRSMQRSGRETRLSRQLAMELGEYDAKIQQARERAQRELRTDAASEARRENAQYVRSLERQIESLRLSEELLRTKYQEQVRRLEESGDEAVRLQFATADLEREEEVLQRISDRAMALNTEMEAPWQVRPLFAAKTPQVPVEKHPFARMGLFAAAGLFLPFALAICWEGYVRRVADVTQLRRSQLPVVGEVAALPTRVETDRRRLATKHSGWYASLFEESIHSVRTGLHLNSSLASLRVLAVASAVQREGKTSFVAQLAVSFARTSHGRVLLIDGDMRSPDLHSVFETDNDVGLSAVLAGEATWQQATVAVMNERLDLIPAGSLQTSPHELVARGTFARLIAEVREHYDTILIDTPPILAAGEALALAAASDATVVCAMQNQSCKHQIQEAVDRLSSAGANPIGLVLNGVPISRYSYNYGYYPG